VTSTADTNELEHVRTQTDDLSAPSQGTDGAGQLGQALQAVGGRGRQAQAMRPRVGHARAAFKSSSHSELHRPHATPTASAASAGAFSDRAATSYGLAGLVRVQPTRQLGGPVWLSDGPRFVMTGCATLVGTRHVSRPPCRAWHRLEKSAAPPLASPLYGCASVVGGGEAGSSSGSARPTVKTGIV